MSRNLSTANQAQVDASHLQQVVLVKLDFDTPIYVHTGIGEIVYDSNTYLGVGHLGSVGVARESEVLGPTSITLTLDATAATHISEALDSGNLYDEITLYQGYRQDDGTLVDTPWVLWKGWYEFSTISLGEQSAISITCQHDLSVISQNNGSRYSHEDQLDRFPFDVGLLFAATMVNVKLSWGGKVIGAFPGGGGGVGPGNPPRRLH